jgi:hypothetical protein
MLYEETPDNFKPRSQFAGIFVKSTDWILLTLRKEKGIHGERWSVPQIKIPVGTDPEESLITELTANFGLTVPIKYHKTLGIRNPDIDILYYLFNTAISDKRAFNINKKNYKGYVWVTPEEALLLPLEPGQDELVSLLLPPEKKQAIKNSPLR